MEESDLKNILTVGEFLRFKEFILCNKYFHVNGFYPIEFVQGFIFTMNTDRYIEIMNICIEKFPQIVGFFKEN